MKRGTVENGVQIFLLTSARVL